MTIRKRKSYVRCDLRERNSLVAGERSDVYSISAYLQQCIVVLRTHGQSAHASNVRSICAKDKKGIDFPTKVSSLGCEKQKGKEGSKLRSV